MANQTELDYTYSTIDKIFRLSMGEMADFSGAKYDGDFSLSLEEAQNRKHQFILDSLNLTQGDRVLDMGCGWGPFLSYTQKRGISSVGLTLSLAQQQACLKNRLEVYLKDCRSISRADYGAFNGLVSVGAFEHFASINDYNNGLQEQVYHNFFGQCHDLVERGDRFYLQTMVFGKNMIPIEEINLNSKKDTDAYYLALMVEQFPGSWLPYGQKMVEDAAKPYFKLISATSGRLDYIETISRWRKNFREYNLTKYALYLSLLPQYLVNSDFRNRVAVFQESPNRVCFEREIIDHFRFVFEKV